MSISLTDEEMESLKAEYERILEVEWHPTVFYLLDAIAKAQLKKVVEWLSERATKIGSSDGRFGAVNWDAKDYLEIKVVITPEDWQALLKEVE